jgi:hypothetical protein
MKIIGDTSIIFLFMKSLVRLRIAKYFTNSKKRFRCEAMYEKEYPARTCRSDVQLVTEAT